MPYSKIRSMNIPDNPLDPHLLETIAHNREICFRRCRALLAGFKATGEQDVDFMDTLMDDLLDFMDLQSDTERLYRDYIAYVGTFDAQRGNEMLLQLEDDLGYWAPVVIAAARVAYRLHQGQTDKGGHDYFDAHLLRVGRSGSDWKEQAVGFLHDAAEDTPHSVDDVVRMVNDELQQLATLAGNGDDSWVDEFDIMPIANGRVVNPSPADWKEISDALTLLNKATAPSREAYIERIATNDLAARVKLNDLSNNMDLTRIPNPTENDRRRNDRYCAEYDFLLDKLYGPSHT